MVWYAYESQIAIDESGSIARSAAGQVYATTDTAFATPLAVTDLAGVVRSELVANSLGLIEQFRVEDHKVVNWKSGDFVLLLASIQGLMDDSTAAKSAAESAQIAAAASAAAALAAQEAAEDAASGGSGGGGGGSGVGNLVIIMWDGVGTQPTRIYPAGHDLEGQMIPLPPEAFVRWRQPSFPLGVAVDGDEYRRVG